MPTNLTSDLPEWMRKAAEEIVFNQSANFTHEGRAAQRKEAADIIARHALKHPESGEVQHLADALGALLSYVRRDPEAVARKLILAEGDTFYYVLADCDKVVTLLRALTRALPVAQGDERNPVISESDLLLAERINKIHRNGEWSKTVSPDILIATLIAQHRTISTRHAGGAM